MYCLCHSQVRECVACVILNVRECTACVILKVCECADCVTQKVSDRVACIVLFGLNIFDWSECLYRTF